MIKIYKSHSVDSGIPQAMGADRVGLVVARCVVHRSLPRHVDVAVEKGAPCLLWGTVAAVTSSLNAVRSTFPELIFRQVDYYLRPPHTDVISRMQKAYIFTKMSICLIADASCFQKPVCHAVRLHP